MIHSGIFKLASRDEYLSSTVWNFSVCQEMSVSGNLKDVRGNIHLTGHIHVYRSILRLLFVERS